MAEVNRKWIFERTKHALQHLACAPDVQIRLLPPFVVPADELALNFDHWRKTFVDNYHSELTEEQLASLDVIDEKFGAFEKGSGFWSDEALRNSPGWETIRRACG